MTLNSTRHSSTGMTPFKLFMSRCEDPVLPVDIMFGIPRLAGNSECELHYILVQRLRMQELAELVQSNMAKSACIQESTRIRGGLKVREYKVGDWVWRWYPPEKSKTGNPWTGPYEVKAVKEYSVSCLHAVLVIELNPSGFMLKI